MTRIWVDTDFGFDDLWALLLLRYYGCDVAGVSLVAGNAPLAQVVANAAGARRAYGVTWPMWRGASRPLMRAPETAQRILGETGMRSRGACLPDGRAEDIADGAEAALTKWLLGTPVTNRVVLALGPLTNLARVLQRSPDIIARRINRIVWMGGSAGPGNHTPHAEFNAVADPEAADLIMRSGVPVDMVDLTFCRRILFGPGDMPGTDPLTADLLGGYLDIALERGRPAMAIYDPLAALALAKPEAIGFTPCRITVSVRHDDTYGATQVQPDANATCRIATHASTGLAQMCLDVLKKEAAHGP